MWHALLHKATIVHIKFDYIRYLRQGSCDKNWLGESRKIPREKNIGESCIKVSSVDIIENIVWTMATQITKKQEWRYFASVPQRTMTTMLSLVTCNSINRVIFYYNRHLLLSFLDAAWHTQAYKVAFCFVILQHWTIRDRCHSDENYSILWWTESALRKGMSSMTLLSKLVSIIKANFHLNFN